MSNSLLKIIVIVGPTASGKTALSLELAKEFNGEIINADSRQIYKEMDIGTAKPTNELKVESKKLKDKKREYIVNGVRHHLMDIVRPDEKFTLAHFKNMAVEKIKDILNRKKIPIMVGGTGLYVRAVVDNLDIPKVAPDTTLRRELEKKNLVELVKQLRNTDPVTAAKIDLKNPRRVIRALEVVLLSEDSFVEQQKKLPPLFNALQIGLEVPREILNERINSRVDEQINDGLVNEVKKLSAKYAWNLPAMSGIGYKQVGYYLRAEMSLLEAIEMIKRDTRRYAKRQMTWFKKDKRIKWVKSAVEAKKLIKKFLK